MRAATLDGMRSHSTRSLFFWFAVAAALAQAVVPLVVFPALASLPQSVCSTSDPDTDADGVADDCDRCLGYDDRADRDGDEIPDGCDQCEGQPDSIDADKDRVPDACDRCASSNDQADADQDLAPDGCDACPGSDDRQDMDGDAVPDGCDVCPGVDDTARDTIDPLICTFDSQVSLTSKRASIIDVLEALAAVQPLRFTVPDEPAARTVTVNVGRTTLEDAIRRVLQGTSYTLTYPPDEGSGHDVPSERVALVTVLADTQASVAQAAAGFVPTALEENAVDGETAAPRDVVREARYGRDPEARAAAVRSLGGAPEDPVARNTILLALRDPAPEVRGAALDVAGQFGRYVGIQHLAEIASSDSEPELRKQALLRLTQIDYPADTASTYVRKALDDPDAGVSALAKELLEQLAGGSQ